MLLIFLKVSYIPDIHMFYWSRMYYDSRLNDVFVKQNYIVYI
jgi:hypothetical protein